MKFSLYILVIILIFFTGDRIFSHFLANIIQSSGTKFSTVYKGKQENNVILLGNSRSDSSFCPPDIASLTSLKTFQLGHKGMSTNIAEVFWRDYIDLNKKPDILLMDITNITDDDKLLYDLKAYSHWSDRMKSLLKKLDETAYYTSLLSNLYLWNGEVLFRSLYFKNRTDQKKCLQSKRVVEPATALNMTKKSESEFIIKKENLNALQRIVKDSINVGIKVVLVFPPLHPEFARNKKSYIQSLINTTQLKIGNDIQILDYSMVIQDTNAFKDIGHLNNFGSKLLLNKMIADGVFETSKKLSSLPKEVLRLDN